MPQGYPIICTWQEVAPPVFVQNFSTISHHGVSLLLPEEHPEELRLALAEGIGCQLMPETGRGSVCRFEYPGGTGVLRHYLRGGLMHHFVKDTYLHNRPWREFGVHHYLETSGFRVPHLLGVAWTRSLLGYRGAIATEYVAGKTLLEWLKEPHADTEELMTKVGALIRQMHDLGVWHADLQLKNILVSQEEPWLLDFDQARRQSTLPEFMRARNLLRLRRSIYKNRLSAHYYAQILRGYGAIAIPGWLDALYRMKGWLSDRLSGQRAGNA